MIILNGMTTNNHTFDDVKSVRAMVDNIVKDTAQTTLSLYVDSVLGWIYLLLSRYDFNKNPYKLPRVLSVLKAKTIASQQNQVGQFAADFLRQDTAAMQSSSISCERQAFSFAIEEVFRG